MEEFRADHVSTGEAISALQTLKIEDSLSFDNGKVELLQCDWARPTSDTHTFDTYFLHMCLTPRPGTARGTFLDGARQVTETLGRVTLVPAGKTLHIGGPSGTQRSIQCSLAPDLIEKTLERQPTWCDATLAQALRLESPEVEWFLLKMYRELRQPGFAQQIMGESLAQSMAVALIRAFRLNIDDPRRCAGGLAPWRMRLIRERAHADQPAPCLSDLADLCGMSVRHLSRAFKEETGMTVAQFVENAMVDRARVMLSHSDLSIAQIAQRLGFCSSASFAFAFRRATGLRPRQLRTLSEESEAPLSRPGHRVENRPN